MASLSSISRLFQASAPRKAENTMALDIAGLVGVIVFYVIILVTGIVAGRKSARRKTTEETFVANRSFGVSLSYFSLTATIIGAGAIIGSAESMANNGLLLSLAPFLANTSMVLTGFLYAPKMRQGGYLTMFDPIQEKFGKRVGGLLVFPDLLGSWFWTATILTGLGSTMALILDVDSTLCVIVSAGITVFYTFFGGLFSVAYTDIIQLIFFMVAMIVTFPFIFNQPSVDLSTVRDTWVGEIPTQSIASYVDLCLQMVCANFGWQAYYQRVLACKSDRVSRIATVLAASTSVLFISSSLAIGVVGSATDWNATDYAGPIPLPKDHQSAILPMVLKYLCPPPVAVIGVGAVAAAAMSSADSSVLSAGTVFAKNIYKDVLRPNASEKEVVWVMRVGVVVSGTLACLTALLIRSVYNLYVLCSDLYYIILFPQVTCALWVQFANGYGSITAYALSLFLRIAAGDSLLGIPVLIRFPFYSETQGQRFPFRSFCMLVNFIVLISVSWLTHLVFKKGWLPRTWDFLRAIEPEEEMTEDKVDEKSVKEFHFGFSNAMEFKEAML